MITMEAYADSDVVDDQWTVSSVIAEKDLGIVFHMEKSCYINVCKQDWLLDDFKF